MGTPRTLRPCVTARADAVENMTDHLRATATVLALDYKPADKIVLAMDLGPFLPTLTMIRSIRHCRTPFPAQPPVAFTVALQAFCLTWRTRNHHSRLATYQNLLVDRQMPAFHHHGQRNDHDDARRDRSLCKVPHTEPSPDKREQGNRQRAAPKPLAYL